MSRWLRGFQNNRNLDSRNLGAQGGAEGGAAAIAEPELANDAVPATLPASIVALDIETTGQHSTDRLVSIAAVRIESAALATDQLRARPLHLIFDPGRKCDSVFEAAHGYDDWLLRHQSGFDDHADDIVGFLASAQLIVAHNLAFKLGFLSRELTRVGRRLPSTATHCTATAYRELNLSGGISLDAACRQLDVDRPTRLTTTFAEAWLTLGVYLRLNKVTAHYDLPDGLVFPPTNLRQAPPKPAGNLPPRAAPGLPPASLPSAAMPGTGWRTVRLSDLQGDGVAQQERKLA
jgi:DNA polymerase-3 subunit epsilon